MENRRKTFNKEYGRNLANRFKFNNWFIGDHSRWLWA